MRDDEPREVARAKYLVWGLLVGLPLVIGGWIYAKTSLHNSVTNLGERIFQLGRVQRSGRHHDADSLRAEVERLARAEGLVASDVEVSISGAGPARPKDAEPAPMGMGMPGPFSNGARVEVRARVRGRRLLFWSIDQDYSTWVLFVGGPS